MTEEHEKVEEALKNDQNNQNEPLPRTSTGTSETEKTSKLAKFRDRVNLHCLFHYI